MLATTTRILPGWIAAALAVGCSADPSRVRADGGVDDALGDAGVEDGALDDGDVDPDSLIDAPIDAPPGTLAAMCGTTPSTALEWEQCRTKRYCETMVHCTELNSYASPQDCITNYDSLSNGIPNFEIAERVRAVADGRAAIDVAQFEQCLLELSPQRCNTAAAAPSCKLRYTGTIANGQPCYADAECAAPGATCTPQDCGASCCTGTCTPKKQLGETCDDFGACEPGLVCSTSTLTCVTGDVGAVCTRTGCDPANYCNGVGSQPGLCVADVVAGGACSSLLQCGGETVCVGLQRPVMPPTCRRVTQAGDACDWFCLGNLYCDLPAATDALGTCRPLPTATQSCSALRPCVGSGVYCKNGSCQPRASASQACADGVCRPGLFCTGELGATSPVCRALFADGESGCTADSQCQSHSCSGTQASAGTCTPAQATCP